MKILYVGDVHATPDELEECRKLIQFIKVTAIKSKADGIVFLGDQYHTHAIVHLAVLHFWTESFELLAKHFSVYAMVGNHDRPNDSTLDLKMHSMLAHKGQINVVDAPTLIPDSAIVLVPYYASEQAFLKALYDYPAFQICKQVVAHQTFDGCTYENGFYAKDGFKLDFLGDTRCVLSGHIHTPQSFGPVWYIGAPRWRTASDANIERAIQLVEYDSDFNVVETVGFDTSACCRKLVKLDLSVKAPAIEHGNPNIDYVVDCHGTDQELEQIVAEVLAAIPHARIRTFRTNSATISIKESEGIDSAFIKYTKSYEPKYGTATEKLIQMARTRLGVSM